MNVTLTCPYCHTVVDVPAVPALVMRTEAWPTGPRLHVTFDDAYVPHECAPPEPEEA